MAADSSASSVMRAFLKQTEKPNKKNRINRRFARVDSYVGDVIRINRKMGKVVTCIFERMQLLKSTSNARLLTSDATSQKLDPWQINYASLTCGSLKEEQLKGPVFQLEAKCTYKV